MTTSTLSTATTPFWSVDAFLYFSSPYQKAASSEMLSRVSCFIESYVLFDKLVLPRRYQQNEVIKQLSEIDEAFSFYSPTDILHSDDLAQGVTIDLNLNFAAYPDLQKENATWYVQHNPSATEEDWLELSRDANIGMADLRLWQACLCNELSDTFHATQVLPLSISGIEATTKKDAVTKHYILEKYRELDTWLQQRKIEVMQYITYSSEHQLNSFPPLLDLYVDQSLSANHAVDVLRSMRKDFAFFRKLQSQFTDALTRATGVSEKSEVVAEWNASWARLLAGSFRKPSFGRRKVSSSEFGKAIGSALTKPITNIGLLVEHIIEHAEDVKAYNRLKVFSDLAEQAGIIDARADKMASVFGMTSFKKITKK